MIGQHLLLRCTKGVYDNSTTPGFKTAAVSDTILKLPSRTQKELNQAIINCAKMPDVAQTGATVFNRGILRIMPYKDALLAVRTFRVNDLCTSSGSVSFSHTYIFMENDRQRILSDPEVLTETESFDSYTDVDARCGGLASKNPILVREDLGMLTHAVPAVSPEIFQECGFRRSSFVTLINAICQRISTTGSVALLLPNVTERDWEEYGGSERGEQLMAAVLRVIPRCITRFFSGVSMWNESVAYDGLKDIKFRIYTGRYTTGLDSKDFSLIDLQNNNITCTGVNSTNDSFANYLWDHLGDQAALTRLHEYIEKSFGEQIDRIRKLPSIMNTVTDLFLMDEKRRRNEAIPLEETQRALVGILSQMGVAIQMFPDITREAKELLDRQLEQVGCNGELEAVMLRTLKDPKSAELEFYGTMQECLITKVFSDNALPETFEYVSGLLGDVRGGASAKSVFRSWLQKKASADNSQPFYLSSDLLQMLIGFYTAKDTDTELHRLIGTLFLDKALPYYWENSKKSCAQICTAMLSPSLTSAEMLHTLYTWCASVANYLQPESERQKFMQMLISYSENLYVDQHDTAEGLMLYKMLFLESNYPLLPEDLPVFPLFVRMMPPLMEEYQRDENCQLVKKWVMQYDELLRKNAAETYLNTEQHLAKYETLTDTARRNSVTKCLSYLETYRIIRIPSYPVKWEHTEHILKRCDSDQVKTVISDMLSNIDKSKKDIKPYFNGLVQSSYGLVFYLNTPEEEVEKFRIQLITVHGQELLQKLVNVTAESAELQTKLQSRYYRLWYDIFQPDSTSHLEGSMKPIEKVRAVQKEIERLSVLIPEIRKAILCDFGDLFFELMRYLTKLALEETAVLRMIQTGIRNYDWKTGYVSRFKPWPAELEKVIEIGLKLDEEKLNTNYLLEEIKPYIRNKSPQEKPVISYMNKRIAKRLLSMEKASMEESAEPKTVLALLLLLMEGDTSGACDKFISYFGRNKLPEDHDAPLYILCALKYICGWYNAGNRMEGFFDSFLAKLESLLRKNYENQTATMLLATWKYYPSIKNDIPNSKALRLYDAAKSTGNEDLAEMYKVRSAASGFLNGSPELITAIVTVLIAPLSVLVIFLAYRADVGIGLAAALFLLLLSTAANAAVRFYINKNSRSKSPKEVWEGGDRK